MESSRNNGLRYARCASIIKGGQNGVKSQPKNNVKSFSDIIIKGLVTKKSIHALPVV